MPSSGPAHAPPSHFQSPFQSPNAIPPRTSSHGIVNNVKPRSSVLRPLSETDWLSQSKKSKLFHENQAQNQDQNQAPPRPADSQNTMGGEKKLAAQQNPHLLTPPQPPLEPPRDIGHDLIYGPRRGWSEEDERILLGPYDYLVGHPGKDIRSQCIAAFNKWLKVPAERLEVITRVVGMLHTASLLVDDVEDSSVLRRGIPVANSIFGVAQTINSANYVYFLALSDLLALSNPTLIQIYSQELLNLHRGQGMELHWRDSLTCPSEAAYLEMVDNKTGGLFRLAIKLMQAESAVDTEIDCAPLVSTIGLLFQILDDHLNLSATSEYQSLKGMCEDLTEGKFSFPVIHAIHADPSNRVIYNILKQKTEDDEVKRYAVRYLEQKGSFEYSKGVVDGLRGKAEKLIAEIEETLGEESREGADGLRRLLARLVVR
ncbi:geranylgeranyl pyrophosphate synthetase [Karstenula rhodostoma CBS 690.94]|uniref:geranylgeranyl diphosphate synthase n=1 Tax=Karstenula rhodostoma CBS 690.94 TaxID=1392251 RepID=A0A9P4P4Z2_9PLEO|nr:geranylgeranyl pyrophosphate synthetase [Karstenula rhodostoma CBS 690.94]